MNRILYSVLVVLVLAGPLAAPFHHHDETDTESVCAVCQLSQTLDGVDIAGPVTAIELPVEGRKISTLSHTTPCFLPLSSISTRAPPQILV
ncbi:MAG: hypothetical protein JSW50_11365, partial [Candidatus Latescibacterota bacterium]